MKNIIDSQRKGNKVLRLGLGVLELKLHEEKSNFNAMLTKMEASTPRPCVLL